MRSWGLWKSKALIASTLGLMLGLNGVASTNRLCEGFLPANDMKIPVGDHSHFGIRNNGGITEAQYNQIMDRIQALYGDVVKQRGGNLVINRLWNDSTVNSSAEQQGSNWIINMYGGIARHPDITFEGEALVACHEMGHHLGGAPKIQSIFGGAWATNEGGADYFATIKCLKLFFASDDNAAILAGMTIDPLVQSKCTAQFSNPTDQNLCLRISKSSESVSYLFQDLSKESTRPQFSTPDQTKVSKTNDDHPATQCRMDTYFAGSICPVAVTVPNSDTDFKAGSCVEGTDPAGFRPRCWFNPDTASNPGNPGNPGDPGNPGNPGDPSSCPVGDESLCQALCQFDPTLPFCKTVF